VIRAKLTGGPKDGLEVVVCALHPIAVPVVTNADAPFGLIGFEVLTAEQVVYMPDPGTLLPCDCRPDCPHASCVFRYRKDEPR